MRGARQPIAHSRIRSVAGGVGVALVAACFYAGAAVATGVAGGSRSEAEIATTVSTVARTVPPPPRPAVKRRPASDKLVWPVRGQVTGRFGEHRGGHTHAGLDVPAPSGTPIRAAADGTVVMREQQSGYGNYTCIAHRKFSTCYAHQSRFRTKSGAKVKRGQVIGYVGDTGSSSTTHLHFEVRRGRQPWGTPLDPAKYLPHVS